MPFLLPADNKKEQYYRYLTTPQIIGLNYIQQTLFRYAFYLTKTFFPFKYIYPVQFFTTQPCI